MKKVLLIFGTRPEAIKMCPLVNELKGRKGFETTVCVTGQHKEMLEQVLTVFDVKPDYNLAIMTKNQTLEGVTAKILNLLGEVLDEVKPDVILVHGDTTTSFVAALAGFYRQIPIGHVEAGLRTHDIYSPFPEEFNRQAVGLVAKYHFAPTEESAENLIAEGKNKDNIYVTGNTVVDAIKITISKEHSHEAIEWAKDSRLILLTAHRRESIGEPMRHMFRAIKRVIEEHPDCKVVYPIHMNPVVRQIAAEEFAGVDRIRLIEPLDVVDFHHFMDQSYLILTDSGGIQEEACSIGKPVLVMRDKTERSEGVKSGSLKLVGTDEERIYHEMKELLENPEEYQRMHHAKNPYGDGFASKYIADILEANL
ncbi:UDP-N-acetylglucosamine 2-epimerase (non-hydrolysing) [Granulicatella balaenopterae]|uniref:UDP-N-acetylglucosamine 2-epimerase (non-hydrolyzing) n=1 Tax=Granulicatella balaenopterae TaxID=137733 RepID=A0A1H9KX50_9LACT|nr:UDP-N-acetylglucosamine 2-epimerase (non-hydrolyzing) [Granulicatella balaenopterae]SER03740.1 UDP-N-acetylglucosamine 2-epimerase (non-hydrolysing) [Granulicatella balaenopterae]